MARTVLAATALLLIALATAPPASAVVSKEAATQAAPAFANWPMFHGNQGVTGVSGDTAVSTANASQLGVRWMTHTFGPVLSSPVTKYSVALNKTLAYVTNEAGDLEAIDTATGAIAWSGAFGVPIHATPAVFGTHVWVGTAVSGRMIKVNSDTGAIECQVPLGTGVDFASPVIATPPGGVTTLYVGVQDNGVVPGPMMAINDKTCAVQWQRSPYPAMSGSWSPDSYGVDKNGVPLVMFGSGDPDCSIYALNALTGAKVWRVTSLVGGLNDFGTGATVSPPGRNGIADGMVYVSGKDRILYAIDLTTGVLMWHVDVGAATGTTDDGGRSTAALAGSTVVVGTPDGLMAVNAVTGNQLWIGQKDTEILSSPLVTGPPGQQVVVYGDLNGKIEVASLATGQVIYSHQTSGYVISSAADSAGNILIGSSDGFLYDLAVGGSNGTAPTTSITSPANNSTIANPGSGPVTAKGTASGGGSASIAGVDVAVQMNGPAGQWWNGTTRSWQQGPFYNPATVGASGPPASWSYGVHVPAQGGVLTFTARAVGSDGLADGHLIEATVTVRPVTTGPHITLSAFRASPASGLKVSGAGFAAGEHVSLSLPGAVLGTATASASGSFAGAAVRVPSVFDFGLTAVTATGASSSRSATAPLYVTEPWTALGHDPQRTGNLPNDHVLSEEVTPGRDYRMVPYWVYSASAPIFSSPAVADGRAYVGDRSGTLSAIDIATGGVAWSASPGGQVDSSPAVDPAAGLVVVGSSDDKVTAYHEKTGALAWTATTGGAVTSSPVIYGGVVYVGSANSKLYAISESTGAVNWTTGALPGPVDSPPAFDPATSTVVVGDGSGAVTAFHAGATSPSKLWHASTGGAVTSSPVIAAGRVYVGSTDGLVYSFGETDGTVHWSAPVGSGSTSITGAMAYQGGHLYVGAADDSLTALDTSGGSVMWSEPLAGPVTGVSATSGMLFTESSNGTVTGLRIGGEIVWLHKTGAGLAGTPAISDNSVFVGGEDNGLYCFTPYGEPAV